MKKGIYLRLSEKIFRKLKEEQEEQGYSSLQEVILNAVRQHYFTHTSNSTSGSGAKRGRPKKVDLTAIVSRKRIFSKRGKGARWKW